MSLPISVAEFKMYCPDFGAIDDIVIEFQLEEALNYTGETEKGWGSLKRFKSAVAYAGGHLLTKYLAIVNSPEGAAQNPKVVTSKTIGDVSISWGGANKIPTDYIADSFTTTSYGYRYLHLREQRPRIYMCAN